MVVPPAALAALLIVVAGLGTSSFILRVLPVKDLDIPFGVRFWLGIALLGNILFIAGCQHWSSPVVALILGLGCAAFVFLGKPFVPIPIPLPSPVPLITTSGVLLVVFTSSFAETLGGNGHDGIAYHLLGPSVWAREGVIRPVLDHSHTSFPASIEVLFAAGTMVANDRSPGVLGAIFLTVLLVQLYQTVLSWRGERSVADLAMALAATMPVVVFTAEEAFVDIPFAGIALAAAYLVCTPSRMDRSNLVWAGLACGLAASVKYTGMLVLAYTALVITVRVRHRPWRDAVTGLTLFAGCAVLTAAPWYIRNMVVHGTPIYPPPPLLSTLLPVDTFPHAQSVAFAEYIRHRGKGMGTGLLSFFLLPWNFTFNPGAFHGAGGFGLAPLGFGLAGLYSTWRIGAARRLFAWAALFTVGWFITQQEARFAIPVLTISAGLSAEGAVFLWRRQSRLTNVLVAAIVGVSVAYGFATNLKDREPRLRALMTLSSREDRRTSAIPYRDAFRWLNSAYGVKGVLLVDPLVPPYYLSIFYIKPIGPYGERAYPQLRVFENAIPELTTSGITHILDTSPDGRNFALDPAASRHLTLCYQGSRFRVFSITATQQCH